MNTRRDRLEIIYEILKQSEGGSKPTQIVYRCNLNFKRFQAHVKYLVERGLLEAVESPEGFKVYRTTEKGLRLLKLLEGE
jgi:predicted transcriptional regulator